MPTSDSAQVVIRAAAAADVPAITAIYNEAILKTTATFDLEPKSEADREQWLTARSSRHPVIVAVLDGAVVGWASLAPWAERAAYADSAEPACYVFEQHRGRGIGRQLYSEIITLAEQHGFHTLLARVTAESTASIQLHELFGFECVGKLREVGRKFGRLLDVLILQKLLD